MFLTTHRLSRRGTVPYVFASAILTLLMPLMAGAESHMDVAAQSATSVATAQVNFKIVIPTVLDLHTETANGSQTLAVMSTGRNVALNATIREADTADRAADSRSSAGSSHIVSAVARKTIAQDTRCTANVVRISPPLRSVADDSRMRAEQLICTVSMP